MLYFLSDMIPSMEYNALYLGLSLSAVFFVRTIQNGWLAEGRLERLLLYPFSEKTLVAAYVLVASGVFILEVWIPLLALLFMVGKGTAGAFAALMLYLLLIDAVLFLAQTIPVRRAGYIGFGIVAAIGLAAQYVHPWLGIALCVIALVALSLLPCRIPRLRTGKESAVSRFVRTKVNNYFVVNGLLDTRAWSSFLLINAFAAMVVYVIGKEDGPVRLFWILACVNTPLTSILSREDDTRNQIHLIGDERGSALRMGLAIFPIFVIGIAFLNTVAAWLGIFQPLDIAFGLFIALLATAISVFLEIKFPLVNVKTERDVFRHPRKYIAPVIAGAVIVAYEFTFGAMV